MNEQQIAMAEAVHDMVNESDEWIRNDIDDVIDFIEDVEDLEEALELKNKSEEKVLNLLMARIRKLETTDI